MAGQKISDAFIEISARLNKFNKQIDGAAMRVQNAFKKVNKKLSTVFSGLGGVIASAFAVQKIAAFTAEAIKLASVAEGVRVAFDRLNDPDLLKNLKEATRGTVSELDLMKQAVQAKNLGVPIKDLAGMFAFATQRAADTGLAVDYLVESLVSGVGKKSTMVLDNLGISAVALRGELGGVSTEMATVADYAGSVGRIGTKSLEEIGETSLTTAQELAKISSAFTDIQTRIGTALIPVLKRVLPLLEDIALGMELTFSGDEELFIAKRAIDAEKAIKGVKDEINKLKDEGLLRESDFTDAISYYKALEKEQKKTRELARENKDKFGAISPDYAEKVLKEYSAKLAITEERLKYLTNEQKNFTDALNKTKGAIDGVQSSFDEADFDIAGANNIFNAGRGGDNGAIEDVPSFDEDPIPEDFDGNLQRAAESQAKLNEQMQMGQSLALGFGSAIQSSLMGALEGTSNFFVEMGKYLLKLAIQLAAAAAAAFALSLLLPGVGGAAGIKLLDGLGGFGGLFGQFAGGGGGFGGGGSKIFGRDIELSNSRTNTFNSRTTGIGG